MSVQITNEQLDKVIEYRKQYISRLRDKLSTYPILTSENVEIALDVYTNRLVLREANGAIEYLARIAINTIYVNELLVTDQITLGIKVKPHKHVLMYSPERTLILSENPDFEVIVRKEIDRAKLQAFLKKISDTHECNLTCDRQNYVFYARQDRYLVKVRGDRVEVTARYYDPNTSWYYWKVKPKEITDVMETLIERALL